MKIRRNQCLRLTAAIKINDFLVRNVRRLHGGALKVETVRISTRGGKITRRWRDLNELGISLADLKAAIQMQTKEAPDID